MKPKVENEPEKTDQIAAPSNKIRGFFDLGLSSFLNWISF
jgi:hypothetical protein